MTPRTNPRNRDHPHPTSTASLKHRDEAKFRSTDSGLHAGRPACGRGCAFMTGVWAVFRRRHHGSLLRTRAHRGSGSMGRDGTAAGIFEALEIDGEAANKMETDAPLPADADAGVQCCARFSTPSTQPFRGRPLVILDWNISRPVDRLQSAGIRLASVPQVRGLPHRPGRQVQQPPPS